MSKEFDAEKAKDTHRKTLSEMQHMKKPNLYAEGGEVGIKESPHEESEHDEAGMDEELHHAIGGEFMDALEKKDKKGIMSALTAAVMQCSKGRD